VIDLRTATFGSAETNERINHSLIGGIRILAGLLWLANIHWKVPGDFGQDNGGGLFKYAASVSRHSPFAPYTWVTEEIVLPNFTAFGWFTLISETLLALLLLAGWKTRWVALAGAGLSVPIMLSVLYYDRADEWSWSYLLMIGVHVILFATNAGMYLGLDGVLARATSSIRPLAIVGGVATVVGLLGLFVSRNADFASRKVNLLGSDAGFTRDDGSITRRWELKFVWFNPLWAILTIVFGIALIVASRKIVAAWVAGAGFGVMAVAVFAQQTFTYLRDDGAEQKVATGSNAAVWGAFALVAIALALRERRRTQPAE
jgi:uncharacterized membrane protein YphA (DoxX/SURF4 family)